MVYSIGSGTELNKVEKYLCLTLFHFVVLKASVSKGKTSRFLNGYSFYKKSFKTLSITQKDYIFTT